jgi:hypothetical protein
LLPLLISTALANGCFTEASSSEDGGGCPDGAAGCNCYGNDTCDGGLECVEGKCYEPDCQPGSELCRCVAGLCLGDLVCVENVCRPPSDDGTGGDGGGDGDGTGGDGGDGGDGTGGDGGDGTGGDGSGGDDGGTATGGPPNCEPTPGDIPCIACAKDNCCELLLPCIAEPACACILECIASGVVDPFECGQQCGPSEVFMQVETCLFEACADSCPIGGQTCDVPPGAPECTLCAAAMCCPLLEACWASDECSCMEACMAGGGIFDECVNECGVSPDAIPGFGELQMCAEDNNCADADGLTCYGS